MQMQANNSRFSIGTREAAFFCWHWLCDLGSISRKLLVEQVPAPGLRLV